MDLEECLQVLDHLLRRRSGSVALDRLAILVDDELGEVPLDAVEQHSALFLLQILPQWVGGLAVDVDLLEEVKLNLAVASEALDLFSISGFLVVELVAWEGENAET